MKKILLIFILTLAGLPAKELPPYIENGIIEFEAKKYIFYQDIFKLPFSPELLKQALIYENIIAPEIAFQQAVHETGNFTSELFKEGANLFGMRPPKVRDTYCIGQFNYHATYQHWIYSVRDYKLWQEYYAGKGYDLTDYYSFLIQVGYAVDPNYLNLIKQIS